MIFLVLELEIFVSVATNCCYFPWSLIAVNFHGNNVDNFVSWGYYGQTSVWWVELWSHKVCSIAIQRKYSLVTNSTLWLENKAHCGTLCNIEHTFSFELRWYHTLR